MICPVCGSKCRVVSSDEGTNYYEPIAQEQAQSRIAELEELLHNREGGLTSETKISVGYLDKLAVIEAAAAEMRERLQEWLNGMSIEYAYEEVSHALSSDAGKATLERIQQLEEALREIIEEGIHGSCSTCRTVTQLAKKALKEKA